MTSRFAQKVIDGQLMVRNLVPAVCYERQDCT